MAKMRLQPLVLLLQPPKPAPAVGLTHDGFKFLEGSFEGLNGYAAVGQMTKSHRGKLYIDMQAGAPRSAQSSTGTGSPSVAYTFSLARSAAGP